MTQVIADSAGYGLNRWVGIFYSRAYFSAVLPVPSSKSQKIDLTQDYPCPCRRKGRLTPIALTEAFGCNRCQQIFAVEDNGHLLEQVSGSYPYKRSWRWNGQQWFAANSGLTEGYLPIALGITVIMVIIWLPLAFNKASSSLFVLIAAILLLAVLPALMVLLAYRR